MSHRLSAVFVLMLLFAGAAGAQSDGRHGIVWEGANFPWHTPGEVENLLNRVTNLELQWVIVDIQWVWSEWYEPTDQPVGPNAYLGPRLAKFHNYDFGVLDQAVQGLTERGISVIFKVSNHPKWVGGQPCDTGAAPECGIIYADRKPYFKDTYYDFVYNLSSRYPDVKYWILWNEPNVDRYFSPQPPLSGNRIEQEFMDLVFLPGWSAVTANIPDARFIGPDVATGDRGEEKLFRNKTWGYSHLWLGGWIDYLLRQYPGYFEVVTIHNYSLDDRYPRKAVTNIRGKMNQLKQVKHIWTTEVNFRNGTCDTSEKDLARYICRHFERMTWQRSFLFKLQDADIGCGFGLLNGRLMSYSDKDLYMYFCDIVTGDYSCNPRSTVKRSGAGLSP